MRNNYHFLWLLLLVVACAPNTVTQDNSLKKYFVENNVDGTFALWDNGTGEITVYNLSRYRDSAYQPASTFKILNSLIGLQTGKIINDSMVIKWDGFDRGRPECNRDMSMYDAFRISCPPWYMEIARRIGKDTMQHWIDSVGYGHRNKKGFVIGNNLDTFWLDNSLKVSPDEQMGLVKRLYFNQLPFYQINQEIVKKAMLFEDNTNYKLSYKTGWGQTEKGNQLGWIIGWIEENRHPYFFVLNIESVDKNFAMPAVRMKMLKDILKKLDFMEGKR
ncbi:MAG TPA: penicillin-binding transpeptidase domain-containing protein [Chitinophagaceae bacterium]